MSPKLTFQELSNSVGENRETKFDIAGTKCADPFGEQRPGERCRGQRSFCPAFPIPYRDFARICKQCIRRQSMIVISRFGAEKEQPVQPCLSDGTTCLCRKRQFQG